MCPSKADVALIGNSKHTGATMIDPDAGFTFAPIAAVLAFGFRYLFKKIGFETALYIGITSTVFMLFAFAADNKTA